jgi:hypothetical protein
MEKIKELIKFLRENKKKVVKLLLWFLGINLFIWIITAGAMVSLWIANVGWFIYAWYLLNKKDFVGVKTIFLLFIAWDILILIYTMHFLLFNPL